MRTRRVVRIPLVISSARKGAEVNVVCARAYVRECHIIYHKTLRSINETIWDIVEVNIGRARAYVSNAFGCGSIHARAPNSTEYKAW